MPLPLKFLIDPRFIRQDGTCIVFIQYGFSSSKHPLLNTKVALPPQYWDQKNTCISNYLPEIYGKAEDLNSELRRMMRIAEDIVLFAKRNSLQDQAGFVKKTFSPRFDVSTLHKIAGQFGSKESKLIMDLYFQIDDYINSKIKKVCKDMPRIYRNMKDHLQSFENFRGSPITFDDLDFTFYEEFVDFLMYDYVQKRSKEKKVGLKINTIGKTIKQFRTFLRNRIRKRIIAPIDMEGWAIIEEEVDAVYLNWEEIQMMYKLDLSELPYLVECRNDFVLACYTGLRFSDFSKLTAKDIRNGMLYKKQQKSNHWVVIPLRYEAKEILKLRFEKEALPQSNAEFNKHVKTIAKLAGITSVINHSYKKGNKNVVISKPKYEWITSHTGRRSFCTNEFLAGTPVELIMKISGHKSVKDFYKYIRITPEEAGQKIKALWEERGQMTA